MRVLISHDAAGSKWTSQDAWEPPAQGRIPVGPRRAPGANLGLAVLSSLEPCAHLGMVAVFLKMNSMPTLPKIEA